MEIFRYTHVVYIVIVWVFILLYIKPKRTKELLPVGIIALVLIFIIDEYLLSLSLYQYNRPLVSVYGAPLFHLIWAAGAGIVFIHFIKREFSKNLITVIFFTIVTLVLEYIAELAGVASRLNGYNILHSVMIDFATLVLLLWLSDGLYAKRILADENK